jgi:aminocarboxymuconate-semialdehyde decarboxylase
MTGTLPRVVDVHVHLIPPALLVGIERGAFPDVGVVRHASSLVFSFPGMAPSPPAQPALFDVPRLAEFRAVEGIELQLAGPWTDLLGYTLGASAAAAWARAYNESLAAACAQKAGLLPLATIPLQHPGLAVGELEAASQLGCRGAVVGTDIPGLELDSPELDPVWEAAVALRMPIVVHPTFLSLPPRLLPRGLKNAVGRMGEATVALTRFVYSGALLRYPGLSVVAALGGGGLIPLTRRIIRNHELGWSGTDSDVAASIGRLYFDTCGSDPAYLRFLVSRVGGERVMLGSDYPFPWEQQPVHKVEQAGLTSEEREAVLGGTARRVFGLD